jgi:two-component system NtrC family response regulator
MAEHKHLTTRDLDLTDSVATLPASSLKQARESAERDMITRALRKHAGKIAPAAAELDISRPTLYELMEKLGIQRVERPTASESR